MRCDPRGPPGTPSPAPPAQGRPPPGVWQPLLPGPSAAVALLWSSAATRRPHTPPPAACGIRAGATWARSPPGDPVPTQSPPGGRVPAQSLPGGRVPARSTPRGPTGAVGGFEEPTLACPSWPPGQRAVWGFRNRPLPVLCPEPCRGWECFIASFPKRPSALLSLHGTTWPSRPRDAAALGHGVLVTCSRQPLHTGHRGGAEAAQQCPGWVPLPLLLHRLLGESPHAGWLLLPCC